MNGENMRRRAERLVFSSSLVFSSNGNPSRFSHFALIAGAMATVLILLLIVLIGSALSDIAVIGAEDRQS
jgi:hypothetical protein